MMREWSLPLYPAERHLLVAELERVQFMGDEESEIVQFILRQFPERPSHPHPLVVGHGFRDGGAVDGGSMLGSSSSCSNTGLAAVACLGSSSSGSNTGLATVAYRGSSSCNTGFTTVVYRGSSSSSNGLAAVVTLINTNVAPILFLPPGRRDSSRHGESIRQEMTGSTAGTPFQHLRLKRCPTPVSSPLRLRRLWRKRARHRRQYLQQRRRPTVLFSPLHRWGGAARAPAPADETVASKAASTASGTVPSATPLRGAVGARESSAGAASSDAVSKAAPATSGTVTSASPLRGAVGARESSAGAAPSDVAAEAFPLAVRYNNSSSSNKDITTTCAVALLRWIGAVIGLDLPFDRGKA